MKIVKKFDGSMVLANLSKKVAVGAANKCCVFIYHQPKMPEEMKKLRKF